MQLKIPTEQLLGLPGKANCVSKESRLRYPEYSGGWQVFNA
jgi:hypothetical protein